MESEVNDVESMSEEDFDREFAVGKKVKAKVDLKGSILSIRMDRNMFKRLEEYSYRQGLGITVAARQLIDEGLRRNEDEVDALANLLEEAAHKLRNCHP
jgi:UDP-N-acetyl-D-mannosaminuronic acid transferase (WecB/TagA/CpsF family)